MDNLFVKFKYFSTLTNSIIACKWNLKEFDIKCPIAFFKILISSLLFRCSIVVYFEMSCLVKIVTLDEMIEKHSTFCFNCCCNLEHLQNWDFEVSGRLPAGREYIMSKMQIIVTLFFPADLTPFHYRITSHIIPNLPTSFVHAHSLLFLLTLLSLNLRIHRTLHNWPTNRLPVGERLNGFPRLSLKTRNVFFLAPFCCRTVLTW